MTQWMQTLQATLELVSEMVDREWRTLEEWQANSAVPRPLFAQIGQWLEAFAGQPLFQAWGAHRDQQRLLAPQLREEVFGLLSELESRHAMAVLCSLPAAQVMGYAQDRLALLLAVDAGEMHAWEQQGFARLREVVSPRTPLVYFVAQRVEEIESGAVPAVLQAGKSFVEQEPALDDAPHFHAETSSESHLISKVQSHVNSHVLEQARENPHFDLRR
ncbi:MAG: hypothetical protein ACXVOI_07950, partial [Tumebacillaceae bacterium]